MPGAKALFALPYRIARYRPLRGNWFGPYLWKLLTRQPLPSDCPIDVLVLVVDHFEPASRFGDASAVDSVAAWCDAYAKQVSDVTDSNGRIPQHTWFYRAEYPNFGCIKELSEYCFKGYGEIEFHLHHGYDTHESFREKLERGLDFFNQQGAMLTLDEVPRRRFSYIAGNWSLDNGTYDDSKSGCNTELAALREAGCYCDFTFPALGTRAQPRTTNSIYYAVDDPQPKSYDVGSSARVGGSSTGDLMIFQGPSGFSWRNCSFEDASIESFSPPEVARLQAWIAPRIHVMGRPEWIFVKLHCHGMQSKELYGSARIRQMFEWMADEWNQGQFRLHFITSREAYNIVKAAEAGKTGNPTAYLDYEIPAPANRRFCCSAPWNLLSYSSSHASIEIASRASSELRIAGCAVPQIEGVLRRVEIQGNNGRFDQIRIMADSKASICQKDGKLYDIPLGCWCDLNRIVETLGDMPRVN